MSVQTQINRISSAVAEQGTLLDQALAAIQNKAAGGGSGGSASPYAHAKEFIWTAPSDMNVETGLTVQHSLGVVPDGFHLLALEAEPIDIESGIVMVGCTFDNAFTYAGVYKYCFEYGIGDAWVSTPALIISEEESITSSHIDVPITHDGMVVPAGKQYRMLVYKR